MLWVSTFIQLNHNWLQVIAKSIDWEIIGKGNGINQMYKVWLDLGLIDGRLIEIKWEIKLV